MFYTKLLCVGEELYGQYDSVGDIITLNIRVEKNIRSSPFFGIYDTYKSFHEFIAYTCIFESKRNFENSYNK